MKLLSVFKDSGELLGLREYMEFCWKTIEINILKQTPKWVVPCGTNVGDQSLSGGYNIIDYKGPPPRKL